MSLKYEPASEPLHSSLPGSLEDASAEDSAVQGYLAYKKHTPSSLIGSCDEHSPPSHLIETALEATQGQIDSFFSQLPYKSYLEEVASVGD